MIGSITSLHRRGPKGAIYAYYYALQSVIYTCPPDSVAGRSVDASRRLSTLLFDVWQEECSQDGIMKCHIIRVRVVSCIRTNNRHQTTVVKNLLYSSTRTCFRTININACTLCKKHVSLLPLPPSLEMAIARAPTASSMQLYSSAAGMRSVRTPTCNEKLSDIHESSRLLLLLDTVEPTRPDIFRRKVWFAHRYEVRGTISVGDGRCKSTISLRCSPLSAVVPQTNKRKAVKNTPYVIYELPLEIWLLWLHHHCNPLLPSARHRCAHGWSQE